jgi:hypothetical protein
MSTPVWASPLSELRTLHPWISFPDTEREDQVQVSASSDRSVSLTTYGMHRHHLAHDSLRLGHGLRVNLAIFGGIGVSNRAS